MTGEQDFGVELLEIPHRLLDLVVIAGCQVVSTKDRIDGDVFPNELHGVFGRVYDTGVAAARKDDSTLVCT